MKTDLISLLPSEALREKIRRENFVFSERDTLLILDRYARTQEERLSLLSEFAGTASEEYAVLARRIAAWEEETLARFMACEEGFIYELNVSEPNDPQGESCFCDTYESAIAAIKAHATAYADVLEPDFSGIWRIYKHPIMKLGAPWVMRPSDVCRVDADGQVLSVVDNGNCKLAPAGKTCMSCHGFCIYDNPVFPCHISAGSLVRYTADHYPGTPAEYGLCPYDFDRQPCDTICVYPLVSKAIRDCDVSDDACTMAHEHIPAPLCDPISPDDISEEMRKQAITFWKKWNEGAGNA